MGATQPTDNTLNLVNVATGADNNGSNGDGIEEDGITTLPAYSKSGSYTVNIAANNNSGNIARLYAWADWNNNGLFEASESFTATVATGIISTVATWASLPTTGLAANIYLRVRLTSDVLIDNTATPGVDERTLGNASNGEVEDYRLNVSPTISGTVWNDWNGNLSIGTGENGTNTSGALFVNLLDASNNVISSATVAADGSYSLVAPANISGHKLVLATSATAATPALPNAGSTWVNTGENVGASNTATQGTTLGIIELTILGTDITAQNFGIEQLPTAANVNGTFTNPGGTNTVVVPTLNGSDPEQGTYLGTGNADTVIIKTIPSSGTLYYNNVAVVAGQQINNYNPTLLTFDPPTGAGSYSFNYVEIDAALKESNTATATLTFSALTISGNVWDDASGNAIKDGSETFSNAGGLYANLVDINGVVISSVLVDAITGPYAFTNTAASTSYKIILTTASQTGNTNLAVADLPTNWVNTGVNISGTANTGNKSGIISLVTGSTSTAAQNFGIEHKPLAGSGANTAFNLGGVSMAQVPSNTFTNLGNSSDVTPGNISSIIITGFPANATSITINGTNYASAAAFNTAFPNGASIPTDANGLPVAGQTIYVDPSLDGTVSVSIPFVSVDNAGVRSSNAGTAVMNFTSLSVSGTVFDDGNGMTDNLVNGPGMAAGSINVLLVDAVFGTVMQSTTVGADGLYTFANVYPNTNYKIILSTSLFPCCSTIVSVATYPPHYYSTGEHFSGTPFGNDGTIDGILNVTVGTSNITLANLAVQQPPIASDVNGTYINPGSTATVVVPTLNGSDHEQGLFPGTGNQDTVIVNTLPTSGTLYYNGNAVTMNQQINNYNPTILTFDPPSGDGSYSFTYSEVDAAGIASVPATATLNFSSLIVSGTVYHDADGGTISGTPTNTIGTNTLWVSLVDGSNHVVASVPVNGDGSYSFGTGDGLAPNTSYLLVLSNTGGTVASNPPSNILANATNTAEGTPPAGDGTPNGYVGVTVGTTSLSNINFAVEELPTAGTGSNTVANPGGTTQVTVPLTTFTNITPTTDPDGTVPSIRITGFPTNATSVVINGTTYTAAGGGGTTAWPAAGVTTPVTSLGSVDPSFNGAGDVVFSFKAIDNIGKEGQNTGTATMHFLIPDLTPIIRLPSNGFAAAGSQADFVAELVSLTDITTTEGSTKFSITAPVGYSISFSPSLTSITAAGASSATAVQNPSWALVSTQLGGRRLNFQAKAGVSIAALQKAELGLTLTRTTSFQGSVPVVTINIADDATWQYDSVTPNNIFTRILNSL